MCVHMSSKVKLKVKKPAIADQVATNPGRELLHKAVKKKAMTAGLSLSLSVGHII